MSACGKAIQVWKCVPEVSSNEIYASKHLQAILDLQCKLEQLTISQVEDEKKSNKFMERREPGNFVVQSELKRSLQQDLSRHSSLTQRSENKKGKKTVFVRSIEFQF